MARDEIIIKSIKNKEIYHSYRKLHNMNKSHDYGVMFLKILFNDYCYRNRKSQQPNILLQIRWAIAQMMVANFTNTQIQRVTTFETWILTRSYLKSKIQINYFEVSNNLPARAHDLIVFLFPYSEIIGRY